MAYYRNAALILCLLTLAFCQESPKNVSAPPPPSEARKEKGILKKDKKKKKKSTRPSHH